MQIARMVTAPVNTRTASLTAAVLAIPLALLLSSGCSRPETGDPPPGAPAGQSAPRV